MGIFNKFKKKVIENDNIKEIISKMGCDCWVIEAKDVTSVMLRYHQALIEGKKEGYTPLIIIPSEMMLEIVNDTEVRREYSNDDRESIISKAKDIGVEDFLKRRLDESMPMEEDFDINEITGEFHVGEQMNHFLSIESVLNQKIIIAKVPTEIPWELAAWVPMGGLNDCPYTEQQVAVFRYWYEKYGATPALVTHDAWELYVENPPKTQEESEFLAWQQFGFCGDIVWQGVETVNSLAGSLINSSVWYFWWD